MDADKFSFPIHELSVVALERVCKNLSLIDMFELSFVSESMRNKLNEANFPVKSIRISYDSKEPSVQLSTRKGNFIWSFFYPEEVAMEYAGEYPIGRYTYRCMKSSSGFHTDHYDVEQGVLAVVHYINSIFNLENTIISELSIDLGAIEDSRTICNHFRQFKQVDRLAIYMSNHNETAMLNLNMNFNWIISNLKLKEIYFAIDGVDNVIVERNGKFDIREAPKRYDGILQIDHICLKYSEWVNSNDLQNLDVKTAIFENSELTDRDLNDFIKNWLNLKYEKLNWLEVQVNGRALNEGAIANGLILEQDTYRLQNSRCSCPYRRFKSFNPDPFVFPRNSKQITRSSDSMTATISIIYDKFFFHVRNEGPITPPEPVQPVQREPRQRRLWNMPRDANLARRVLEEEVLNM